MIDVAQAVALALIQGLTEFLPVSSSAHLIIPSLVLGWTDQGLAFDVAVHVGTLAAVLLYYREDLLRMADSWLRSLVGGPACDDSRMVWYLLIATIPAGVPLVCKADLDGDKDTDVSDFGMFVAQFGNTVPPGTLGDYDANGIVNVLDFSLFAGEFGCVSPI